MGADQSRSVNLENLDVAGADTDLFFGSLENALAKNSVNDDDAMALLKRRAAAHPDEETLLCEGDIFTHPATCALIERQAEMLEDNDDDDDDDDDPCEQRAEQSRARLSSVEEELRVAKEDVQAAKDRAKELKKAQKAAAADVERTSTQCVEVAIEKQVSAALAQASATQAAKECDDRSEAIDDLRKTIEQKQAEIDDFADKMKKELEQKRDELEQTRAKLTEVESTKDDECAEAQRKQDAADALKDDADAAARRTVGIDEPEPTDESDLEDNPEMAEMAELELIDDVDPDSVAIDEPKTMRKSDLQVNVPMIELERIGADDSELAVALDFELDPELNDSTLVDVDEPIDEIAPLSEPDRFPPTADDLPPRISRAEVMHTADDSWSKTQEKRAARAITVPSVSPYRLHGYNDDPDDYVAPGGLLDSTGATSSKHARDAYAAHGLSGALYRAPCMSLAHLALYHDLMSQSPWSDSFEGSEDEKYRLMRRFEQMYVDGEHQLNERELRDLTRDFADQVYTAVYQDVSDPRQCDDDALCCKARPFDFRPWGTKQLFENWPSNRPVRRHKRSTACVVPGAGPGKRRAGTAAKATVCEPAIPTGAWLASKVSTTDVPFDIRWYDVDLYFAHASLPRLFRMHVAKFLQHARRDAASAAKLETFARQLDSCKNSTTADWPQCLTDYLLSVFRPDPADDARDAAELRAVQRDLFATGGYLGLLKNKKRVVTYVATMALMEQALNDAAPFGSRVEFATQVLHFVSILSGVYRMASSFSGSSAATNARREDRDVLVNDIVHALSRRNKPFSRVAYLDYWQTLVVPKRLHDKAARKVFVAAETLRWTLWWLSDFDTCVLTIDYDCLEAAVRLLHERLPPSWYVIDAHLLRNFAIVNFGALTRCANRDELSVDDETLHRSSSAELRAKGDFRSACSESQLLPVEFADLDPATSFEAAAEFSETENDNGDDDDDDEKDGSDNVLINEKDVQTFRRMRLLNDKIDVTGGATAAERAELGRLTAEHPALEKALELRSEYARLRRLQRRAARLSPLNESERGQLTPSEARDLYEAERAALKRRQLIGGPEVLALLDMEADAFAGCDAFSNDANECAQQGCRFVDDSCYDFETQAAPEDDFPVRYQ